MIAKQVNTEKHRRASHRMPEVEFIDRARQACLGRASRTACAHGTMRVKRLGISKSAYGPGVLPILMAAPAPSRWAGKYRGFARLVFFKKNGLLAFRITAPCSPMYTRTSCTYMHMTLGKGKGKDKGEG